ncbi:MAG TPA: V-type ATP synthase subunit I [Clostridiales bacterium]|nr:V-type ATP synthase subunit I [Clostridiales bacterium]
MAIIDMKKFVLIAHNRDREMLTKMLQRLGTVEVDDALEGGDPDGYISEMLQRDEGNLQQVSEIEAKLSDIKFAIDLITKYSGTKRGMLVGKRRLTQDRFMEYISKENDCRETVDIIKYLDGELAELRNEITRLNNQISQLTPWWDLGIPLNMVGSTGKTVVETGVVDKGYLEGFKEDIAEKLPTAYIRIVGHVKEENYILLIYHKDDASLMNDIKKQYNFNRQIFSGIDTTPKQYIQEKKQELHRAEKRRQEIEDKIGGMADKLPLLEAFYDYLSIERDRMQAISNFGATKNTFLIKGWVPAMNTGVLQQSIEKVTDEYIITFEDPGPEDDIPVALENPAIVKPFEAVTDLYSTPSPRSIDPNVFMAPFYFLFFGMMVSDAGYGIVLAIMSAIALKKLKAEGMIKKLLMLLVLGGISTVFWGAMFGGWFGLEARPILFNPMEQPIPMLVLCFGLGLIHIFVGMGLQAYLNIRQGKIWSAIFDQGFWYVFLIGLILLFLPMPAAKQAGQVMAIGGGIGLVLTQGRDRKGVVRKFISGLMSLYNVTGYLSDVLSYSRLFALGLATGVIAMVINTMVQLVGGSAMGMVLAVIVLIGGHLFNLLINVLGAFVHASRLQYIEFFGKFFEGGGRAFAPFKIKTKFIQVEKKEAI